MDWPEPVARVAAYLLSAGAEARIEEFAVGTPTAEDAAHAVGATLAQIVKSLVFVCDERPVLVLVPGDRRADARKIAALVGARRARVAGPEEVEDAAGYPPGGVAPFALRRIDRLLAETTLLAHEEVWVGAGSTRHLAALAPTELLRLTDAEVADVVRAPA